MTENSKSLVALDKPILIETDSGDFELTINQVKNFVAKSSTSITTTEAFQFLQLCRFNNLNPWVGDAYLVKFGEDCQMITSKGAYMKRAERAKEKYEGFEAGIVIENNDEIIRLEGALYVDNGENNLVGGWAKVHRSDRKFPITVEVSFDEYVGKTREGKTNRMWKNKPATMIRKVAICQALREAFPDIYQGLVSEEEVDIETFTPTGAPPIDVEPIDKEGGKKPAESGEGEQAEKDKTEKPKRRQRRQTHVIKGKEVKTNGITGAMLEAIEQIETNYEQAEKLIDSFMKERYAQDLTFLTEDEGKELMSTLMGTLGSGKDFQESGEDKGTEAGAGEDKSQDPGPGQDDLFKTKDKGKLNCPDRGEMEIEVSFCEQSCPKSTDKTCIHFQE